MLNSSIKQTMALSLGFSFLISKGEEVRQVTSRDSSNSTICDSEFLELKDIYKVGRVFVIVGKSREGLEWKCKKC